MDQGNLACSTAVSSHQQVGDAKDDSTLDAAVTTLLTKPRRTIGGHAAGEADADLLALTQRFDAAHSAWLDAAAANDEPHKRCSDHIKAAMARGVPAIAASEAAWALPGVRAANDLEDSTFTAVCELAQEALRMRPQTLAGLAFQARAVKPLVWMGGNYDVDASLGEDEDLNKEAVRRLIESVLAFAETNGSGPRTPGCDDGVWRVIDAHDKASAAYLTAAIAADPVAIRRAGHNASVGARIALEAARNSAKTAAEQAWRDLFCARPSTTSGLLQVLRHTAEHFDTYYGMEDAPDVFAALIGAVEGLHFALRPRPSEYDLSLLSISELEQLARIANRERETLMAVECQGFCWSDGRRSYSEIGKIVETEGERMAFLGDHAVHEIERRRPTDKNDINLRLEALVRHHLNCNGYVEPELLTEVVQTWGRA